MNLKHLDDKALLLEIEKLVREERELLTLILRHLEEIDRRKLFAVLKFSSLFEYATKRLGYSEDQAYRRVQAMRLLKEIPELEEKVNSGSLTLTHLGMAQSYFKREEKASKVSPNKFRKIEILEKLENKSTKEAELVMNAISGENTKMLYERMRAISDEWIEIKFRANASLAVKIQSLKSQMAHSHPTISLAELFEMMCDLGLEKLRNSAEPRNSRSKSKASLLREVRSRGACQNCGGTFALEIDHITPRSHGGKSNPDNLRLLCRSCNQRAAIEKLGLGKMSKYLEKH